jgi:hypothetical protein
VSPRRSDGRPKRLLRLATDGKHEQAADLVADLLVDGSWTAALPALAVIDRESLAAADGLLDGRA